MTEKIHDFAPMGLDAVAQRIANANGHDLDAQPHAVQRETYSAITITEDERTLRTYAFVLNFFNIDGDYADFIAFGITMRPESACIDDDEKVLLLLDKLYSLVDRPEFIDRIWDLSATVRMDYPMINVDLPLLEWGFHSQMVSEVDTALCSAGKFLQQLRSFLGTLSQEFGSNYNISVWEYQNIDF